MKQETTDKKSLGETFYNRYHELWFTTPATWNFLPVEVQRIYERCAEAVRAAVLADLPNWGLLDHGMKIQRGDQVRSPQGWVEVDHRTWGLDCSKNNNPIRRRLTLPAALVVESALGSPEGVRPPQECAPPAVTDAYGHVRCPYCGLLGPEGMLHGCSAPVGWKVVPTPPAEWKPDLYPFRMEEAKRNLGNVVTSDWRRAVYERNTGDPSFPHQFRVEGSTQIYTSEGRYLRSRKDPMDLYMTTPEPLPVESPASQVPVEERIESLTAERDAALAGQETWRKCSNAFQDRAMVAESRVKDLEQDLTSLRALYAWVPLSSPPTKEDANEKGIVWVWDAPEFEEGPRPIREVQFTNITLFGTEKFWMRPIPPPLPTAPVVEDPQRRKFEKWVYSYGASIEKTEAGNQYTAPATQSAWMAFLAGQNSTKP